jgi:hypothetical protein
MAYQLQPGLLNVDRDAFPYDSAYDAVTVYPQPSKFTKCCRASTMEYGTAPYMAGKGAPNELIMVDDELRSQSTSRFRKVLVRTYEGSGFFPLQDVSRAGQAPTMTWDPGSTRADKQNFLFKARYCKGPDGSQCAPIN